MTPRHIRDISEERKHHLDAEVIDYDSDLSFDVDNVVGCYKIKTDLSNNIFKPMLNNDLFKFSYGVTRSVLIYGLHGAGKMTITEYIAHQLRWKIVTFDALDIIQMEPDKVIYKLEDAYEYSVSRQKTIILIKNYEEVLNIEKTNYQYYIIIKKTIVHIIRSIIDKMNILCNSKVMIICLVNSDTIDTYLNNNLLDVFTYVFKHTNPTLDDISMYIVKRIEEHPHDITWILALILCLHERRNKLDPIEVTCQQYI